MLVNHLKTFFKTAELKMSNQFIREKALPNILIHFLKFKLPNDEEQQFVSKISKAINKIYGKDRFVIYSVSEDDLKLNSRILSAKAILIITKQNTNNESIKIDSNDIKKLTLSFEQLSSNDTNDLNYDYFQQKIQSLISLEKDDHQNGNGSADPSEIKITDLYLFDSQGLHLKWPLFDTNLKLINYAKHKNEMISNDSVFLVDQYNIEQFDYQGIKFDANLFFDHLKTNCIGRTILFQNISPTTMKMADLVKSIDGIVCIANYQTTGLGRNDNKWLSPFGCACFTMNLRFPFSSPLISKITLIQHLASLAIVMALPNDKLNIKIKWPNDILHFDSMSKIAGILTRSYSCGNYITIQVGIGINVSNRHPSLCLDELISHYNNNNENEEAIKLISREEMIARTLNSFERLYIKLINNEISHIKQLYCDYWIHTDSIVDIYLKEKQNLNGIESVKRQAKITGIDDNGYLLAEDLKTKSSYFLQPDSNRFDMMNGLTGLETASD